MIIITCNHYNQHSMKLLNTNCTLINQTCQYLLRLKIIPGYPLLSRSIPPAMDRPNPPNVNAPAFENALITFPATTT